MIEAKVRTVENLLHEGPPLEWYSGVGRMDNGIMMICYTDSFLAAYRGELKIHFGDWCHKGVIPRVFGIPEGQTDRFDSLVEELHNLSRKVYEISGFWPEEIAEKSHALSIIYRGQKSAPFQVTLVDPTNPNKNGDIENLSSN